MNRKLLLFVLFVAVFFTSGSLFAETKNIKDYVKVMWEQLGFDHDSAILKYKKPIYAGFHFTEKKNGEIQKVITKSLKNPSKEINIYFLYRVYPFYCGDKKQDHRFFLSISSYMNHGTQDEKEIDKEFTTIVRPKSKGISSVGMTTNRSLFNDNENEPPIGRFTYCTLLECFPNSDNKIEYRIDFEISEEPIKSNNKTP